MRLHAARVAFRDMENLWLAADITGVAALALLRLRQMLRWVPCEATFLGLAQQAAWGFTYTGQALPIAFRLPDGREVRAALRNYGRGGLPPNGARLQIRYDPDDPTRAEWAAAVPLLALVLAVLLAVLATVVQRALRDAGFLI
ncbi:DUF3592 domain-containing protein [Pararoseomonas indoligenes]|uniref:DUF3592 domain-containing protein n=1 Tax=Roseomonas indoligenes TaxID=2820811 RepID=A0A940N1T5_9PROT|nr:DUF3592 domain-containing protein [Pararoseomonas indoligenes]MBP0496401.1 hypothetical protein [Pararoseomonas indoligenes]